MAIFGKTESSPSAPRNGDSTPFSPPAPSGAASTVLGAKTRFVGDLFGDEDVAVHGHLEGKIRVDRRVTIGPTGSVAGDVTCRSVVVAGKVEGQIHASERAELAASASVTGSVRAPKVVIAEGAQLQGDVGMSAAPPTASTAVETTS